MVDLSKLNYSSLNTSNTYNVYYPTQICVHHILAALRFLIILAMAWFMHINLAFYYQEVAA